ncbi:MAG: hypothetical protein WCG29_11500 [Desulfomonile sp.]
MKMRLTIVVQAIVLLFTCPAWGQNKQVRDAHDRLVETWSQHGSSTDVRGPDGSLKEIGTHSGNQIEVRDRNGRLLRI